MRKSGAWVAEFQLSFVVLGSIDYLSIVYNNVEWEKKSRFFSSMFGLNWSKACRIANLSSWMLL